MPEVVVYAVQGRSQEQKENADAKITQAVVESFNVPNDKVVVSIIETDPNHKSRGGVLYSER